MTFQRIVCVPSGGERRKCRSVVGRDRIDIRVPPATAICRRLNFGVASVEFYAANSLAAQLVLSRLVEQRL